MLQVLVVNNNRYLINTKSGAVDKTCQEILDHYPPDAVIEFVEPTLKDVLCH